MDPTVAKFRVNGLCAAPFQPFLEDGSVDLASIAAHVRDRGTKNPRERRLSLGRRGAARAHFRLLRTFRLSAHSAG
jgi:hypothetical protein